MAAAGILDRSLEENRGSDFAAGAPATAGLPVPVEFVMAAVASTAAGVARGYILRIHLLASALQQGHANSLVPIHIVPMLPNLQMHNLAIP